MPSLIANMRIQRVVIHQIFERNENRERVEPLYNNDLTRLDRDGVQALQDRIVRALGNDSVSVEMDITNTNAGSCFDIISEMLDANDQEFINKSKLIASRLTDSQSHRKIPGGIVVVLSGTIGPGSNRFICILKAEIHNGFSLEETQNALILKFLSELLLTPQQKLYKIGLFIELNRVEEVNIRLPEDFKVLIYDSNLRTGYLTDAATYFYESFLGCTFSANSKKLTQDFYIFSRSYIDQMPIDDEEKVELNYALYTYLKVSRTQTISTLEFADNYLAQETVDEYQNFMEEKNFPANAITKDLTLIEKRLLKRKLKFSSNVRIEAPSDSFTELVEVVGFEDGKTIIKISGRVQEQG